MFKNGDKVKIKANILKLVMEDYLKVCLRLPVQVAEGELKNLFTVIEVFPYHDSTRSFFQSSKNGIRVKEGDYSYFKYPETMFELYNPWKQVTGEQVTGE